MHTTFLCFDCTSGRRCVALVYIALISDEVELYRYNLASSPGIILSLNNNENDGRNRKKNHASVRQYVSLRTPSEKLVGVVSSCPVGGEKGLDTRLWWAWLVCTRCLWCSTMI